MNSRLSASSVAIPLAGVISSAGSSSIRWRVVHLPRRAIKGVYTLILARVTTTTNPVVSVLTLNADQPMIVVFGNAAASRAFASQSY
jgi:hypothetical protein